MLVRHKSKPFALPRLPISRNYRFVKLSVFLKLGSQSVVRCVPRQPSHEQLSIRIVTRSRRCMLLLCRLHLHTDHRIHRIRKWWCRVHCMRVSRWWWRLHWSKMLVLMLMLMLLLMLVLLLLLRRLLVIVRVRAKRSQIAGSSASLRKQRNCQRASNLATKVSMQKRITGASKHAHRFPRSASQLHAALPPCRQK